MCPTDDSTTKSPPRNRAIVRAFAGDSTMTSGLAMAQRQLAGWMPDVKRPADVRRPSRAVYGSGMNPKSLIETFGTLGVLLIIFAESGLLIGFFLPGDS